jgi:catechol 2,3-dioxygenase-like lactoylglutathione lyase family enzyme
MIDHLSTYATDYPATKRFYEAVLGALGHSLQSESVAAWNPDWPTQRMCAFGPPGRFAFWIIEVRGFATPRHTAFVAKDRAGVNAFYRAAITAGGRDNGPPGLRPEYHANYYGAFAFDPDGNNVEAVCHKAY